MCNRCSWNLPGMRAVLICMLHIPSLRFAFTVYLFTLTKCGSMLLDGNLRPIFYSTASVNTLSTRVTLLHIKP